jgi:hypothetical protein
MELETGEVHEEEAALRIANAIAGADIDFSQPKEGRVNFKVKAFGLLKINVNLPKKINSIDENLISTQHNKTVCNSGTIVDVTKIVPLFTTETKLREVANICQKKGNVIELNQF